MKNKYVAVDLDGCLAKYEEWEGLDHIGKPKPQSQNAMNELKKMGFEIIIHTCRSWKGHSVIERWLNEYDIPYDYINKNPDQPATAGRSKIFAHYYIDDRNPTFKSLLNSVNEIKKKENNR